MNRSKNRLKTSRKRVLVALSGGIDSAVAAYQLIQAGYQVEAAFMKNWSSANGLKYDECPWLTDRQDALRVAAFLGIPMHTLNFEREYKQTVMDYFFKEYSAGRTPNPDVMCNKEIKFKLLYKWARKNGFDYMATGHYAQVLPDARRANSRAGDKSGQGSRTTKKTAQGRPSRLLLSGLPLSAVDHWVLARSADEFKDQTYFIYNILTSQLPHLLFPIGALKKAAVRALAKKLKLPNADKKESMGLCFVGQIRLKDFLEQKLKVKPGPIIDLHASKGEDQQIGEHQGLAFYTVGQRQGIRVGRGGPWFVVRKELQTNTLVVTNDPDDPALQIKQIEVHSLNWITRPRWQVDSKSNMSQARLSGRYRHQGALENLTITELGRGHYRVEFDKAQKAIASGQSLVLYHGKVCLGGGVIV